MKSLIVLLVIAKASTDQSSMIIARNSNEVTNGIEDLGVSPDDGALVGVGESVVLGITVVTVFGVEIPAFPLGVEIGIWLEEFVY